MTINSSKANKRTLKIIGAFNDVLKGLDTLIGESSDEPVDLFFSDYPHSYIAEEMVKSLDIDLLEMYDKLEACRAIVVGMKAVDYDSVLKQLQDAEEPKN